MESSIRLGGDEVRYHVRYSVRARRPSVRFRPVGEPVPFEVVFPARARHAWSAETVLRNAERWVRRQLRRLPAARPVAAPTVFLYEGAVATLRVEPESLFIGAGEMRREDGRLTVGVSGLEPASVARAVRQGLASVARSRFESVVGRRAGEMRAPARTIVIRNQETLWGSCSPRTAAISLNVRLLMAPPAVLDYVVVHELAHFSYRGHGPRFWTLVERFCADARVHRRWLAANGWRLRFPVAAAAPDGNVTLSGSFWRAIRFPLVSRP